MASIKMFYSENQESNKLRYYTHSARTHNHDILIECNLLTLTHIKLVNWTGPNDKCSRTIYSIKTVYFGVIFGHWAAFIIEMMALRYTLSLI